MTILTTVTATITAVGGLGAALNGGGDCTKRKQLAWLADQLRPMVTGHRPGFGTGKTTLATVFYSARGGFCACNRDSMADGCEYTGP